MTFIAKVFLAASCLVSFASLQACIVTPGVGGSSSSESGPSSGATIDSASPTCMPGDFKITGTADGQSMGKTSTFASGGFYQGDAKSEMSTAFADGSIDLSWKGIYSNDAAGDATGSIVIDGVTWCAGQGSQVEIKGGPVLFHLKNLSKGDCAAKPTPVAGEMYGCYASSK